MQTVTESTTELRPYQRDALNAIHASKAKRALVAIPTGGGKGYITKYFPQIFGERILLLAHREELLNQIQDHLLTELDFWSVGVEQANRTVDTDTPCVIASVPTLTASGDKRLKKLSPNQFDAIIVDEAHHSTANSYLRIWQHFGLLDENNKKVENPPVPLIGLTATPARGDNVGLCNVFDEIIYQYKLEDAIRDGWLVPIHAFTIKTKTSLDNVRIKHGKYAERELAHAVDNYARNDLVATATNTHAAGLKTLIFCVTVNHARNLAETFIDHGRSARAIDGSMSSDEREAILQWFDQTPGAVLTNCQIVTEGVDIPSVEAVVMARPTRSKTLYAQCLGRGTRLAKGARDIEESRILGKDRMILLDIADSVSDIGHRAVNICDIFGAPLPNKELKDAEMLAEVEEQKEEVERSYAREHAFSGTEAVAIDLFAKPEAVNGSKLLWLKLGDEYRLNLGNGGQIIIEPDTLDQWFVRHKENSHYIGKHINSAFSDRGQAIHFAESWVEQNQPNSINLVKKDAWWRKQKPSEKQINLCQRLGIPVPPGATKGTVSIALDRHFQRMNQYIEKAKI